MRGGEKDMKGVVKENTIVRGKKTKKHDIIRENADVTLGVQRALSLLSLSLSLLSSLSPLVICTMQVMFPAPRGWLMEEG